MQTTASSAPASRPKVWKYGAVAVLMVIVVAAGVSIFNPLGPKPSPITVFSADAYVAESSYLASGFANSTGAPFLAPTAAGSFALAQQIKAGAPVSVFISVSKSAITSAYLGDRAPGWGIGFAGDQMALAYVNSSSASGAEAGVIAAQRLATDSNTTTAWHAFFANLTAGSVKVGIANPNTDPAGYRAWIVLEAAGYTYSSGNSSYFTKKIVSNHGNVTGASAAQLVAPLQTGNINFLFIYKSAAISHHLSYLSLPRQVNLGDPKLGSYYSKFTYTLTGGVQKGAAIILFITIPKNGTDSASAIKFVVYVVQHSQSMSLFGLKVLSPAKLYNSTAVPTEVQQLVSAGSLTLSGSL